MSKQSQLIAKRLRNLMAAIGTLRSNTSSPVSQFIRRSPDNPAVRASARRCVDDRDETVTVRRTLASAAQEDTEMQARPPSRLISHQDQLGFRHGSSPAASPDLRTFPVAYAAASITGSPPNSPRSSSSNTSELEVLRTKITLLEELLTTQQATITTAVQGMVAQQATLPSTIAAALATARGPAAHKPFDAFPNLAPYSGDCPPNRFLRDFRTANQLRYGGPLESTALTSQLLNKLTDKADRWAKHRFADNPPTVAELSEGLRAVFGREYEGARALLAVYRLPSHYHMSGAQRLFALEERREHARDYFVPRNPGPSECEFCQVLDLFGPHELPAFLAELTANAECNEAALQRREELDLGTTATAEGWGPSRSSLLGPPSADREELFALRVRLAKAALQRIPATPSSNRDRSARACLTAGHPQPPTSATPGSLPAPPTPNSCPPPPVPPALPNLTETAEAQCCVLRDRTRDLERSTRNPPHYYGANTDPKNKARNSQEFHLRKSHQRCFRCTLSDVKPVHFNECPLHGVQAALAGTAPSAPAVTWPKQ